jgi:hypothetical protein
VWRLGRKAVEAAGLNAWLIPLATMLLLDPGNRQ